MKIISGVILLLVCNIDGHIQNNRIPENYCLDKIEFEFC